MAAVVDSQAKEQALAGRLKDIGLNTHNISLVLQLIKSRARHKLGFVWSEEYVANSILGFQHEAGQSEISTQSRDTTGNSENDTNTLTEDDAGRTTTSINKEPGTYFFLGLLNGRWVGFVAEKASQSQLGLF